MVTVTSRIRCGALLPPLLLLTTVLIAACSGGGGTVSATPLSITTTSLPKAQAFSPYSTRLAAIGGRDPYVWTLTGGTLPPGLSLDSASGSISGTPLGGPAASTLTFQVKDAGTPAQSASATLGLSVLPAALQVTTNSLPDGNVGTAYDATLSATGGTPPYTWTQSSGALPAGLALDAGSGTISGTPTANSAATALGFTVTDAATPAASAAVELNLTISAVPLVITTSSLPDGVVGTPYTQTLSYTGGTGAVTWTITSGALPGGLTLAGASGVISGQPTGVTQQLPVTLTATDSGHPSQTQSAALSLTINPSGISVAVSPHRAGLTAGQTLTLVASTNDGAGVSWSSSPAGGSFSPASSQNGANVSFTAPATPGVYTLTATSNSDATRTAALTVGVTNLTGVYTYHNDLARDGANTLEYALTHANVTTATFGKLFSCSVDGAIYAQPLWVANLSIAGVVHNVVFVATEHDSLYAFDADTSPCQLLWQVSLIDAGHGAGTGETTVPSASSGNLVGQGFGDVSPEIGITGTPVIDPANGILYVVAKSVDSTKTIFYQRLHALDLASGSERAGSPVSIAASYQADNGTAVNFSTRQQNQRTALTLTGGSVYMGWGSHEDKSPWYGWIMGYSYSSNPPAGFTQQAVLNVTPNTAEGGIWMAGGAPSVDSGGHLYVITGNGPFDGAATSGATDDFGDSFLQLKPGAGQQHLGVSSFFTPTDQQNLNNKDLDFGSGGSALVLNLSGSASPQHVVVGGGKDGALYVLNGDQMGGSGDANALQLVSLGHAIFATPAFWNNTLYVAPVGGPMLAYTFDPTAVQFTAASSSVNSYGFPGSTPSVSASGTSNGIVWGVDNSKYCTPQSGGCGPAVLHAYAAGALGTELWNSTLQADTAGFAVKFTVPTVANGKVYLGTRGNNTGGATNSTSVPGELEVYGLKPN
jgi:hypothetical protein